MSELTTRINALFERGFPDGSKADASKAARRMHDAGYSVSRSYLAQLVAGTATNPSHTVLAALAQVFAVDPNYFFDSPPNVLDELPNPEWRAVMSYARFLAAHPFDDKESSRPN